MTHNLSESGFRRRPKCVIVGALHSRQLPRGTTMSITPRVFLLALALGVAPQLCPPAASVAHADESVTKEQLQRAGEVALSKAIDAAQAGKYEEAKRFGQIALVLFEQVQGPKGEGTIIAAKVLVKIHRDNGHSAEADEIAKQYLKEQAPSPAGDNPLQKVLDAVKAGNEAWKVGKYKEASAKYEIVMELAEKHGFHNAPRTRQFRSSLAVLYVHQLAHAKAEALYRKNLEYAEADRPQDPMLLSSALQEMGFIYTSSREFDKALPHYERALKVLEDRGREDESLAMLLGQFCALHVHRHDYAAALARCERGLQICDRNGISGATLPFLQAMAGMAYSYNGDYSKAEPLLESYLSAAEKTSGSESSVLEGALDNVGWHYRGRGDFAKAERLIKRSIDIIEKRVGRSHNDVAMKLNHLAELYWAWNQHVPEIAPIALRASEIDESTLSYVLSSGSEDQKRAYLGLYEQGTDRIISYHVGFAPRDPLATRLALNSVLRRKGRVLDAVSDSMRTLREKMSSDDQKVFDELKGVREQLSTLTLHGPQQGMSSSEFRSLIDKLSEGERKLQSDLSSRSASYRVQSDKIEFEKIKGLIPDDAALIEIVAYRPFDIRYRKYTEAFRSPRYVAYVLRKNADPAFADLGEVSSIDADIKTLRTALSSPQNTDAKKLARALHDKVIQPLRANLSGVKHLLISPDGMLNLVPFGALADDKDRYLVQDYEITYLSSGRDLLRLQASAEPKKPPALIGNPTFDQSGDTSSSPGGGKRSVDFGRVRFTALPGTEGEIKSISGILDKPEVMTGADATERSIKKLSSPVLLHVATHGFFLSDISTTAAGSRSLEYDPGGAPVVKVPSSENPLIRSGLALAGANTPGSSADDGVLTALEVAGLDLGGTQLVVLSACDTGVGEVRNGDGVYGLRRALVIAGSEAQVMSLWKVDDAATRDLMVAYYKGLQQGEGRTEALRNVQVKMLANPATSHPFYWASFIPSGQWTKMKFKPAGGSSSSDDSSSSSGFHIETDESIGSKLGIGIEIGGTSLRLRDGGDLLADQTAGAMFGRLTVPVLGRWLGRWMVRYVDQVHGEAIPGLMLNKEGTENPGEQPKRTGFLWSWNFGYEGMVGLRLSGFGLHGGGRVQFWKHNMGNYTSKSWVLPIVASVSFPWFEGSSVHIKGWASKIAGDAKTRGLEIHVPLKVSDAAVGGLVGRYEELDASVKGGDGEALGGSRIKTLSIGIGVNIY
jgi:CHAT domain-containing protein